MGPDQYIRLSQLNDQIQDAINARFKGQTYWIVADITNHSFKADKKIHYFELVEKSEKDSTITAKIMGKSWGTGALRILDFEIATGQRFTNNLHVLVQVSVDFHPLYGLSVNLLDIDSNFMLGILEQQRNATLARLVRENGYIWKEGEQYSTLNSRLKLPAVIQKIAVISSSSSAGNEDFRHTMVHNDFGYAFQIDDYHTVVQGDNNAKLFLNKLIDVYNTGIPYDAIVIARGGGSQSDFLIFDNYGIGRAVAKFPIPVITGIGHQKNVSITDLMAHTSTKTPTKAAEFIIAHNRSFEEGILALQRTIVIRSQQLFLGHYRELSQLKNAVSYNAKALAENHKKQLERTREQLARNSRAVLHENQKRLLVAAQQTLQRPKMILAERKGELVQLRNAIKTFSNSYLRREELTLEHHQKTLKIMSPQNILRKGYAIVRVNNAIASSGENIEQGDDIEVILKDTRLISTVKEKIQYNGREPDL
ncbi:exodeoxyribonuclease VII large subunit [Flavobacterium ginsenosidimutans]|uniref:exodeoxyribonuclease VII large subunit n=1 Tax=Flavobacterium ginsenosidimutans TaxID=687844 RepID=UPI000DAEB676|nr:exodeoxyribonuclease VII large subunit [Flavobacterium ginsenosidimutans]KAF2328037.1 exodeoxyribonuclease VII large subunit [Flavobacterium ginsenosidimutans]